MLEILVRGSTLLRQELESPIIAGIIIFSWAALIIGIKVKKASRAKKILAIAILSATTAAVIGGLAYTFNPSKSYGVIVEDHTIKAHFYMDDTIAFDLCNSTIKLTARENATSALAIRTNGLADPTTGILAGYFKTKTGEQAYVLITGKQVKEALIVSSDGRLLIVGIPGIKDFYKQVLDYMNTTCR